MEKPRIEEAGRQVQRQIIYYAHFGIFDGLTENKGTIELTVGSQFIACHYLATNNYSVMNV